MKNSLSWLLVWLVGVVFGILLVFWVRKAPEAITTIQYVDRFIKGDTARLTPPPVYIVQGSIVPYKIIEKDTVYAPVDTALILADYFATRVYADTLINNDSIQIFLGQEISMNRVMAQRLSYSMRQRETIITRYRSGFRFNGSLMAYPTAVGFSTGISYQFNSGSSYGLSAGYYTKPFISATVSVPFK